MLIESNLPTSSQCLTLKRRKEEDIKVVIVEGRVKISPLAQSEGVDIKHLKNTGPHGRIVKVDVLDF
ncbi:unnamed protein product [Onchocerca flexuosa]|uniref:Peripheral subunit-binding (PSBD) domain-containing protein n=1 Tax=Onchocerca flexuosa TaxID=387005 RepID=A0A183H5A4_9BILA|nr:unnamed protein product [Onchocerca flexuosa]